MQAEPATTTLLNDPAAKPDETLIDIRKVGFASYALYHERRMEAVLAKLAEIGSRNVLELGAHPWTMTSKLIDHPELDVCGTVSAEEITDWPDEIEVSSHCYRIRTEAGNESTVTNYSANLERTLFDVDAEPDTVLACEIIEHMIRSPHVMFLNINRWLPLHGKLLVTTPNGSQFSNPFHRHSPTPAYRSSVYERHSYLFTADELTDLVSLCGFRIVEAGYWDVYDRSGWSRLYGLLEKLPFRYCQEKFRKTIFLVAEKNRDVSELEHVPKAYDPRGSWEFVRPVPKLHRTQS